MNHLTITLHPEEGDTYRVRVEGPAVGEAAGTFTLPYDRATWTAILQALEPGFDLASATPETRAALAPLGDPAGLPETAGRGLADALLADATVRSLFDRALGRAEARRQPLPVSLHIGSGADALAGLPWELLHYRGRFLLADTSIALSRYPEGVFPPTEAFADLPLRVLLVLAEPADASPVLPAEARHELSHGLRSLDEMGAVIVDPLRPPTYDTLIEAVRNGGYHMVVFYGHGVYDPAQGGLLLFEDEHGGGSLVKATELGAVLRNTDVRLVLLAAGQPAQVAAAPGEGTGAVWTAVAPALVRAGVPLAIGMQVSMRVDAALAFIRQFALSLAAGKPVVEAVADARLPLIPESKGASWFIPALYGRPAGDTRLFDPGQALPENTAGLRAAMRAGRAEIERLERSIGQVGVLTAPQEIAALRTARSRFAEARAELAQRTPGGYAQVVSPLYGVPSNPIFAGRSAELQAVSRGLRKGQPVVLWGTGGIGKTALAAEVARRQSWRFPGGVLWLDCRGGPALDTLLDRLAAFCGLDAGQIEPEQKEATVRRALAGLHAPALVVWDNAEDVWQAQEVRRFVEQLPADVRTLITTREDPERAMWTVVELEPLAEPAMTELFYRLAAAAGVKVGTPADLDAIPRIVGWLEGHPLALQLVVPLARKRGLQRVWQDLQKRPLKGVEAAFEASYERLSAAGQRLFARLSVFAIPFGWEAAEALLPGEEGVDELLDTLVQRALVGFDGARYSYHALVRQVAYQKLQAREDIRPVHRLAAEHLRGKLMGEGGTPEEALESGDQWERAEAWGEFAAASRALVGSLDRVGYWAIIDERLERALAAVREHLAGQPGLQAELLNARGLMARKDGRWQVALQLLEEACTAFQVAGDELGLARAGNNLGLVYADRGNWPEAIAAYEQARVSYERLGDARGVAQAGNNLGLVYYYQGNWPQASAAFERALAEMERLDDTHGMAAAINNLGNVYRSQAKWSQAIASYEEALALYERLGDIHQAATTASNLGNVYLSQEDPPQAIAAYEHALAILERLGDLHGMAQTANNLGLAYADQQEWEQAAAAYERSLGIKEQLGDVRGMAMTMMNLGSLYARLGEWTAAIEAYEHALDTQEALGDAHGMGQTLANLAEVFQARGDDDRAARYAAEAHLIFTRLAAPETGQTAQLLVNILGTADAAIAYVAQLMEEGLPGFDQA